MNCAYCNKPLNKSNSEINRARRNGSKLFCNRTCTGLSRRHNRSDSEKKKLKREYDKLYRAKNINSIKKKKKAYNQTPEGRATQKRSRDKLKEYHNEYCRTDSYRKYKKEYDQVHRAKKNYGEYWESIVLLMEIDEHIPNREVKKELGLTNKSQKRKRNYGKIKC